MSWSGNDRPASCDTCDQGARYVVLVIADAVGIEDEHYVLLRRIALDSENLSAANEARA
jgi:hypothetical protein